METIKKRKHDGDGVGHGEEPARKRMKCKYTDTIRVLLGANEEESIIHMATACAASDFSRTACSDERWIEGREKVVRLPDCDPEAFDVFAHWAYTGTLDMALVQKSAAEPGKTPRPPTYLSLGRVWAIGSFLQARRLRNGVVDRMLEKMSKDVPVRMNESTLAHIWATTPQGSTVQRLMTDLTLFVTNPRRFNSYALEWPQDILLEAGRRYFSGESQQMIHAPWLRERCSYHEHEAGEEKCN